MLENIITQLIIDKGTFGIIIGMLISSSVFPLPSEVILVSAGLAGISPIKMAIWGGVGSTLGAIIAFYIGKHWGRKFVDKIGKYVFVTQNKLELVDHWFDRFGNSTTLIARILPIIPHKIFSLAAGFGKMNFRDFVIFTLIGSIPRCFLLSYFGQSLLAMKNIYTIIGSLILVFLLPLVFVEATKKIRRS